MDNDAPSSAAVTAEEYILGGIHLVPGSPSLDDALGNAPALLALRELTLTSLDLRGALGNRETTPGAIAACTNLSLLDVGGNRLRILPVELAGLRMLKVLSQPRTHTALRWGLSRPVKRFRDSAAEVERLRL